MISSIGTKAGEIVFSRAPLFTAAAALFFLVSAACSVPNLETPECIESRETVKQFYSKHFGNEFRSDAEQLEKLKEHLSSRLFSELSDRTDNKTDYFTQTADHPKAFRVGGCESLSDKKSVFNVLLFWKTETSSEQREIAVETIRENNVWLIDKVANKQ